MIQGKETLDERLMNKIKDILLHFQGVLEVATVNRNA